MSTAAPYSDPAEANRVKVTLASEIVRAVESQRFTRRKDGPRVLRLEVRGTGFDPLSWLDAQKDRVKTYWADRERQFEMAGIGEANTVRGHGPLSYTDLFGRLNESLSGAEDGVRYYGGVRFSDHPVPEGSWRIFGSYRFVLPRFELCNHGDGSTLACNLDRLNDRRTPLSEILSELDGIVFPQEERGREIPILTGRRDTPDKTGWEQNVESAIRSLGQGAVQKIVLARKSSFEFKSDLNPILLLLRLKSAMPHCFYFCTMLEPGVAFIGASPERLYMRQGRLIRSEAIAGTRPRGTSAATDEKLGQDLLRCDKDLREHRFVVQGIKETLSPLCEFLEVDSDVSLLRLTGCQHLLTGFKGNLGNGVRDVDLLRRLQPTPAVGGYPTAAALEEIHRLEPFDRGWYAGPIGWVGCNAAEFAVAIRSGLVDGSRLSLFSGAGIVEGSTPEDEWNEIENKITDFIGALTDP